MKETVVVVLFGCVLRRTVKVSTYPGGGRPQVPLRHFRRTTDAP